MRILSNILLSIALLLMTGLAGALDASVEEKVGLTLLISSGSSGHLFDDDGTTVASLAATIRAAAEAAREDGREVVVIDAGRTLLPYAESRYDGGATMFKVLQSAGCSVFAPAPMDFAIGIDRIRDLAADARLAVIRPFTIEGEAPDSVLKETAELRPDRGPVLEFQSLMANAYTDDLASAGILDANALEAPVDPSPADRIRIAVLHSRGHGDNLAGRALTWRLVGSPGGLDVLIDPDLGADVVLRSISEGRPVILAGRDQDRDRPWTVARLDLETERRDGAWQVTTADLRVIGADLEAPTDAMLVSELESARGRFLSAQSELFGDGAPTTRAGLEAFVLETLRERARSEVAILNRGALRPVAEEYFADGRLTRETVVRLLSIDQYLVAGHLTGAELQSLAADSVRRVLPDGTPRMDSLLFKGVTFHIKGEGTPSAEVDKVLVNGRPVRSDDSYSVVTNYFLASGGDEYPVIAGMSIELLRGDEDTPEELRADIVLPRLETAARAFVDLDQRALWHWGIDRASLGFYSVSTDRDPAYDDAGDSRARADDSTATLAELRAFVEREKPTWTWQNLLWGRYGVLDLEGTERRETDDHLRLETSAVLTRASVLGGHPYSSFNIETEFRPGEKSNGERLPRRFEQSLATGINWSAKHWPRIRLGLSARNYSHIDRDMQAGVTAEAFYLRKAAGGWPGIDAHIIGEYMKADDSNVSRFDLDLRLPFPIYGSLELTPAFNYYIYRESALPGSSKFLRFSLNLSYSWEGKHQSW